MYRYYWKTEGGVEDGHRLIGTVGNWKRRGAQTLSVSLSESIKRGNGRRRDPDMTGKNKWNNVLANKKEGKFFFYFLLNFSNGIASPGDDEIFACCCCCSRSIFQTGFSSSIRSTFLFTSFLHLIHFHSMWTGAFNTRNLLCKTTKTSYSPYCLSIIMRMNRLEIKIENGIKSGLHQQIGFHLPYQTLRICGMKGLGLIFFHWEGRRFDMDSQRPNFPLTMNSQRFSIEKIASSSTVNKNRPGEPPVLISSLATNLVQLFLNLHLTYFLLLFDFFGRNVQT